MSSVNQFAWVPGTATYKFGYDSTPNIPILGAPADTNWRRWAMLWDGAAYRMYFFKGSTGDSVYQFAFDGTAYQYAYGGSIPVLTLTDAPADADADSFAMLHDGNSYHLYLRQRGNPTLLYQFMWVPGTATYQFGYRNAIPRIQVTGFPADTDWSRWSMLWDGTYYRIYAFKLGSNTLFYQGAYNPATEHYELGFNSIRELTLADTPGNSNLAGCAMLHDSAAYRFYLQTE